MLKSKYNSNTIGFFLYKQRRPEACIILHQCTRRSYYLPVYFQEHTLTAPFCLKNLRNTKQIFLELCCENYLE
jgi:hypothetical protein